MEHLLSITDEDLIHLERAYRICDMFHDFYQNEIMKEHNTLYMSDEYEDLNTAKSLIGKILNDNKDTDDEKIYTQSVVSIDVTRKKIGKAYRASSNLTDICLRLTGDDDAYKAAEMISNAFYLILNASYIPARGSQTEMNNVIALIDNINESISVINANSMVKDNEEAQNMINIINDVKKDLAPSNTDAQQLTIDDILKQNSE